ncbi:hypothetical protein ABPG74_002993 [Tetrahymena malaccensis]
MNKRPSRQSSKCEGKLTNEVEIPLENIQKKLFKSQDSAKTINSTRNEQDNKEQVKMRLSDLKQLKSFKETQENILMNIENKNIQKHVQELLQKFDSPFCGHCLKRRADKVCINKKCGKERYMELICGKCHQEEHTKSLKKSEIDIEEYFIKLATFLNEESYNEKLKNQKIDINSLSTVFDEINNFRLKLDNLKQKIQSEIEFHITPYEMQTQLQNTITDALSLFKNQNIQEQLNKMKDFIIYKKNQFVWNDAIQKFNSFTKMLKDLEDFQKSTNKKISKSFIGGFNIDLSLITAKICPTISSTNYGNNSQKEIKSNEEGEIKMSCQNSDSQYYIDLPLQKERKYKIRFRFDQYISNILYVGVIKKNIVDSMYLNEVDTSNFFMSFQDESYYSKVIKGSNLSYVCHQGLKIEMRVDLENNCVDYYDYPDMNHINSSNDQIRFENQEYVLAFYLQGQYITIESIEEVFQLEQII